MLTSDGSVMRTCAKVGLKDCVEMEGKTYCYCKNQLCNTPDGPLASFGNQGCKSINVTKNIIKNIPKSQKQFM